MRRNDDEAGAGGDGAEERHALGTEERQNVRPQPYTSKPETRDPRPGTRNPKPETRDPKPETRTPKPEPREADRSSAVLRSV